MGGQNAAALSYLTAGAQGVSSLMQVFGGVSARSSANTEAQYELAQANIAQADNNAEAARKAREVYQYRETQASVYNQSGVTLEGSPMIVMEETRRLGQQEVDALLKRGQAIQDLAQLKAKNLKQSGRNALLGSIGGAALGGLNTYLNGRQIGLFGNSNNANTSTSGKTPSAPPTSLQPAGYIIR